MSIEEIKMYKSARCPFCNQCFWDEPDKVDEQVTKHLKDEHNHKSLLEQCQQKS